MRSLTWVVLTSIVLSGCRLVKPYQGPVTSVPSEWKSTEKSKWEEVTEELCNWWEVFNDPVLNQLEEQAVSSNYDLLAALDRVAEARAQALAAGANLSPQVNFSPSYTRYGLLFYTPIGSLIGNGSQTPTSTSSGAAAPAATTTFPTIPSIFRDVQSQYELPFNMSYEIDLWRKLQGNFDAALIRAQASVDDYYNVLLTLTADVAANYFLLRDFDAQQVILKGTIETRQKAYDLNHTQYTYGIIDELDVSRASVELENAKSDSINVGRQRTLQENIIATLVGTPASVFSIDFDPLLTPPPVIPAGLPSELLLRRPDILEAERLMAAAYSEIEVAYAAFFPSLNLNATLGLESPVAHLLFDWRARLWQIGMNVVQSVIDGGRNQANLDYSIAKFEEAYAQYEQVVLTAFKEVEDALTNIKEKEAQYEVLTKSVAAAQKTLDLSQQRYTHGLVNYLDVVVAERSLLESQQNQTLVLADRYTNTVELIKALGGTWCFE